MAARRSRRFECTVVNETVQISLRKQQRGISDSFLMVQCDQEYCQYVGLNAAPCPLTLEMFADEIEERQERARRRQEEEGLY